MLKIIKAGEIGDILEIRGRGKEDRRGGGEDLWVLGSHVFGIMKSLAGGQPHSCTASAWKDGHPVTKADVTEGAEGMGPLAADHVQARYDFGNNVIVWDLVFGTYYLPPGAPERVGLDDVTFPRGYLAQLASPLLLPRWSHSPTQREPTRT